MISTFFSGFHGSGWPWAMPAPMGSNMTTRQRWILLIRLSSRVCSLLLLARWAAGWRSAAGQIMNFRKKHLLPRAGHPRQCSFLMHEFRVFHQVLRRQGVGDLWIIQYLQDVVGGAAFVFRNLQVDACGCRLVAVDDRGRFIHRRDESLIEHWIFISELARRVNHAECGGPPEYGVGVEQRADLRILELQILIGRRREMTINIWSSRI